jgi:NADH dehydrogenase
MATLLLEAPGLILLTGASGNVGRQVLGRLTARGERVRVLVRDPRRLGSERVRVQIALGDLSDPASFRNALRGVETVVHLAAAIRDQPRAPIEELNAVATLRLVRAAERARTERFVFFSALGASLHSRARFFRSKALAERAVEDSTLQTTIFAPSIVYSPDDPWITLLRRMSLLPALLVSGHGRARYQPIWAGDVADCVIAELDRPRGERRHRARRPARVGAPAPAAARAAARGANGAARRRGRLAPQGVRHLGGGRADGDPDDEPARELRRRVARGPAAQNECGAGSRLSSPWPT